MGQPCNCSAEYTAQLAANPLETRLQFNRYDANGNALELQKTSDVKEVLSMGYHGNTL